MLLGNPLISLTSTFCESVITGAGAIWTSAYGNGCTLRNLSTLIGICNILFIMVNGAMFYCSLYLQYLYMCNRALCMHIIAEFAVIGTICICWLATKSLQRKHCILHKFTIKMVNNSWISVGTLYSNQMRI